MIYFTWKKEDKRVTKAQQMVSFDDAVCTFKSQIKVLKEHIFVKRVQNDAYNKHKAELTNSDLRAIEMIRKMKSKASALEIKAFRSLHCSPYTQRIF